MLLAHLEALQHLHVRLVADERAVLLGRLLLAALLRLQLTFFEIRLGILAVAERPHLEEGGKRVHGLRADAVHAGGELEAVRIELAARIHLTDAVHHLAERNAASVVPNRRLARVIVDVDVNPLALPHHELVNRVVDDLLHQDVNAIMVHRARPGLANVHAGTHTNMRHRIQRLNAGISVIFRHITDYYIKMLRSKCPTTLNLLRFFEHDCRGCR